MSVYEMAGWLAAMVGAWAFYDATLTRLRSVFDRLPRRDPNDCAPFLRRTERREVAARAARWQSVAMLILVVGAAFALLVRLAS